MKHQWRRYLFAFSFVLGATSPVFGADATFATIDYPDAISTQTWGIDPSGDVVGFYMSADKVNHGFLKSGTHFTTIDYPGAAVTLVNGINSRGDIVGEYGLTATSLHRGFLLSKGGVFTSVDFPSATFTSATGINARGDIVGFYTLADNINHGFLRIANTFSTIDFPGSTSSLVNGINSQGDIVGGYVIAGVTHGFLLTNGEFSSFHPPGAVFTAATGINPSGEIVGRYRDAAGVNHGFVLSRGEFTAFDFPGATFTGATAVNINGDVLGRTIVAGVTHGFLMTPARPERHYTITDLGAVGASPGQPFQIAANGLIAGVRIRPDGTAHSALWYKGWIGDFGGASLGGQNDIAFGINDHGWAVGQADTSAGDPRGEDYCGFKALGLPSRGTSCLPFVWQNGVMTRLPTLGGNNGQANQINNRGQVAGVAETAKLDPDCPAPQSLQFKAAIWEGSKVQELPSFGSDPDGYAVAINQNGQAAGASGKCSTFQMSNFESIVPLHAILWDSGIATDLGNLGGTGNFAGISATNLNNKGHVVGESDLPGDTAFHGFLWTKETGMQDLGTLPGDVFSVGVGINDKGEIVGGSLDENFNPRAYHWENGVMTDLNTLIPAASPLFLIFACSINSHGEIVGLAVNERTGEFHGYLATPAENDPGYESAAAVTEQSVIKAPVLSGDARKLLLQGLSLGRFGGWLKGPR